jgi:molybdopterin-containing oxidoreductase family iron-sulfur binding subunit
MTKVKAKDDDISTIQMYSEMEDPSENPEVVFQPVMCQHCNHAPCETVCPVAATTHSAEGLNHMTYNRCVGTRYCANNCPYKVRRFNWFQYSDNDKFDYNMNDDYGKMVLNPDVVVRSRGVIEKCSMCIQQIQQIKLKAKINGAPVKDEDVQTACSSACSTGAMIFGDSNDTSHKISELKKDPRKYDLLDHLNVAPSVFYQTKIRNKS